MSALETSRSFLPRPICLASAVWVKKSPRFSHATSVARLNSIRGMSPSSLAFGEPELAAAAAFPSMAVGRSRAMTRNCAAFPARLPERRSTFRATSVSRTRLSMSGGISLPNSCRRVASDAVLVASTCALTRSTQSWNFASRAAAGSAAASGAAAAGRLDEAVSPVSPRDAALLGSAAATPHPRADVSGTGVSAALVSAGAAVT
mmetsp:Transcript_10212/g.39729  ORF Transcript_10212/g.39729 Transcript_10212/m.39729 type:complete len:204 (+) Transcript_10212:648-1259(+)